MRQPVHSLVVVCFLLSSACDFVRMRGDSIRTTFSDSGLSEDSVTLGDETIRYWDGGQGPPVLLIHGFGASAVWQWYEQIPALTQDHRVIVPDLLWFGGSSSTDPDYSLHHQVRAVIALLDHLGIERVDVVGLSYGGMVTYGLATAAAERVGKVVIVDSPGPVFVRADHNAMLERLGIVDASEIFVPETTEAVGRLMQVAYHDPPYIPDVARRQVIEQMYSEYIEEKKLLLAWLITQMDELGRSAAPMMQPTLLLWGRHDQVFPVELARRLEATLDGRAQLHVIDDAAHVPNLEQPEEFNRVLRAFLSTQPIMQSH